MPIEIQIEKQFGKGLPVQEVQAKARAYASEQIKRQMVDFDAWACSATGTTRT